ncbi:MAG: type II toxin-antitoxin system RelE/ParE family toxin [Bryobacterales bacterium]|nr:type II toxin-antitoxin system RelE/ParE family toxin [Bryobacterales bacterium]
MVGDRAYSDCRQSPGRHPGIGRPGRVPTTRELVVPGTPYLIPYRVHDRQVELIGIFHGRQKWPMSL